MYTPLVDCRPAMWMVMHMASSSRAFPLMVGRMAGQQMSTSCRARVLYRRTQTPSPASRAAVQPAVSCEADSISSLLPTHVVSLWLIAVSGSPAVGQLIHFILPSQYSSCFWMNCLSPRLKV